MDLGARIRAGRVAAKMSQTDLGQRVGISFQQMQKYEKGKDRVAVSTLRGFAAALGVHPGSFFDDIPAPAGGVPDVKAAMRIAERIQRVRDPMVVKRLMALVDALAPGEDDGSGSVAERISGDSEGPSKASLAGVPDDPGPSARPAVGRQGDHADAAVVRAARRRAR